MLFVYIENGFLNCVLAYYQNKASHLEAVETIRQCAKSLLFLGKKILSLQKLKQMEVHSELINM